LGLPVSHCISVKWEEVGLRSSCQFIRATCAVFIAPLNVCREKYRLVFQTIPDAGGLQVATPALCATASQISSLRICGKRSGKPPLPARAEQNFDPRHPVVSTATAEVRLPTRCLRVLPIASLVFLTLRIVIPLAQPSSCLRYNTTIPKHQNTLTPPHPVRSVRRANLTHTPPRSATFLRRRTSSLVYTQPQLLLSPPCSFVQGSSSLREALEEASRLRVRSSTLSAPQSRRAASPLLSGSRELRKQRDHALECFIASDCPFRHSDHGLTRTIAADLTEAEYARTTSTVRHRVSTFNLCQSKQPPVSTSQKRVPILTTLPFARHAIHRPRPDDGLKQTWGRW
jgi:hypothetical protein